MASRGSAGRDPIEVVDLRRFDSQTYDVKRLAPNTSFHVVMDCLVGSLIIPAKLAFTKQAWRRPENWTPQPHYFPVKRCASCRTAFPLPYFLKYGTEPGRHPTIPGQAPLPLQSEYYHVWDHNMCARCYRVPYPIRLHQITVGKKKKVHTKMKFVLREEDGAPYSVWDPHPNMQHNPWHPVFHIQVRKMDTEELILRFQPTFKRDEDMDCGVYGSDKPK